MELCGWTTGGTRVVMASTGANLQPGAWRTDVCYNLCMEAFATPQVSDRLDDAVDALVHKSIDGVSSDALGADLVEIRRASDRLEAEFIRRLYRFDRAHGAAAEGGVSTVSWLRSRCGMTVKAAAYRVHLARTWVRCRPRSTAPGRARLLPPTWR